MLKKGRGSVLGKDADVTLRPGRLYLFPDCFTFDYACSQPIELYWLHFRVEFFPGFSAFNFLRPRMEFIAARRQKRIFERIIERLDDSSTSEMVQKYAWLLELLSAFFPDNASLPMPQYHELERFRPVIDLLGKYPERKFDLRELAGMVNLHPTYFSNRFREIVGVAPMRFQIEQRMSRARELLVSTDLQVREIAAKCGYENEFLFSRIFKKYMGLSPTRLRKKPGRMENMVELFEKNYTCENRVKIVI